MQKLTFQTLSHYGAMYGPDGEEAEVTKGEAFYRASEVEAILMRINAINDNPARFDPEIDKLTTLGKEVRRD